MQPEEIARQTIDKMLADAGWQIQHYQGLNLGAGRGVAVREFPLKSGFADYLIFVDRKAIGVVEAKAVGIALSGIIHQSQKYSTGLRDRMTAWHDPLPYLYESTGVETLFTDLRDPDPRSRNVFSFHRPETLAEWAKQESTLRSRLQQMPPLATAQLWKPQIEAIQNLEQSFAENRPRALIQMATGSGKTFTAVNFVYRLVKYAGAKRVLFLVDRGNLGRQTYKEFQQFATPDDGRKFTELYNVQHLQSNVLDPVSQVHITTIQRLYSMLRGDENFDSAAEERSAWEMDAALTGQSPKDVVYNAKIPIEYYDFIITDECHRSIYNLWRQVLDYFDAFLIGLTATPSKQTLGFFNRNLVMEYDRQRAVSDGVNVDGEVYHIRTRVTQEGSKVDAGYWLAKRNQLTRQERWEELDEELVYTANQLDREVVTPDQIRTVIRTFRERLFSEIAPGRTIVPKTLIFAKDDSHAETIVAIVREEFGRGNDFCHKITYNVSGKSAEDLIAEFRNSYNPRIAVTVDMIATGTDIKPLEGLLFMRDVKSRLLFEQMLGRGTRVISDNDLKIVTQDAGRKERFVIVDAVGVTDKPKFDTQSLERKRTASFDKLLEAVAMNAWDGDTLSSLAGRLATLDRKLSESDNYSVAAKAGGMTVKDLSNALLDALDVDRHVAAARQQFQTETPTPEQVEEAAQQVMSEAAQLLGDNPGLRNLLIELQQRKEQIIDSVTVDVLREAGYNQESTERARRTVDSFVMFVEENLDQITALQMLYNRPYSLRHLTNQQLQTLKESIEKPPHGFTTEKLWQAYAQLERDKVKGVGTQRILTDLISLVRRALRMEDELVPYPERVRQRYQQWLEDQQKTGIIFTPEQRWWLDRIAEQIGLNLTVQPVDFDYGEFYDKGGRLGAMRVLGKEWLKLVEEMNGTLLT
ncbi:MAG: type I restriction-modification enzyme R subunit C-terminal domain-containing protein [Caldilineaceae bacterium]